LEKTTTIKPLRRSSKLIVCFDVPPVMKGLKLYKFKAGVTTFHYQDVTFFVTCSKSCTVAQT